MKYADEKRIVSKAERENNIAVIEACRVGLHFIYVSYRTKTGGGGWASLVYNGRCVSVDSDDAGDTLDEMNEKNFVLDLFDGEEIPEAFLPRDLIEVGRFNQWRQ